MINANDHLKASAERIQQLKNQKKSKERREQEAQRKIDIRRNIMIGGLMCHLFPELMELQPQWSAEGNVKEFKSLENILRVLSEDTELLTKLKEEAGKLSQDD